MNGLNGGDLRQRITLQSPGTPGTTDTAGQRSPVWTTIGTYWAKITPTGGTEAPNAARNKAVSDMTIDMRWNGLSISPLWRVLYGSRTFAIQNANNVEERNISWKLTCKEVSNPA